MTTTQDTQNAQNAENIQAAKQEIISALDQLSLAQLRDVQNHIETLQRSGLPKGMSGAEFVALMQELREKYQITDEEAEEFDRILREGRENERRLLAQEYLAREHNE